MNRIFLLAGSLAFFSLASLGVAGTCTVSNPGWTFQTLGSCGSGSNGVSFTQSNGQVITIFPEEVSNGDSVSGLFEVQKGQNGNLASGIAPYDPSQGSSPYNSQLGIQDNTSYNYQTHSYKTTDLVLFIEVSDTGVGAIADGTTLKFLMQEGNAVDEFNVYTLVNNNGAVPPSLASMGAAKYSDVAVGTTDGNASTPQFQITTTTNSSNHYEWIAIEADCDYLLLNSITETSAVPEPRFYGLLLAALLGLVGVYYRNRRTVSLNQ